MLRLRNPIIGTVSTDLVSILSQEETQTDDQGMVDLTSVAGTVLALSGEQTVGAQGYRDEITGTILGTSPITSQS